ncbi:selenocysteine-specific elongation factor [Gordonia polyisoprenivorans NBRC 16320 = JCM 10675]|uniref:Selenocysteine-specific translation elongation factor n=1 Tax=Gordonia polyisoprenivorans TaxID=84595 RepID=A0A846WMX7_9ACTN|nr:selenocysteine-specific translation elongation factor [Gordonia polyisoprenivorans]NKY01631.1 selenocysteine-specific translation elongation factor [Gordonia polyisoprenivorans]WCB36705.1 selenocysteine-specific translation elongation factor [Gordonia polyisoprenivorans]GAB25308.1 selenocysteine-specific elongation factor [Gordonia polyisoprenivorans NBRC 16320 = JCM 10675]
MFVVATAGHVDHGKSTLVRALTGIEPDRWAEERRRGLTIDLGFAWTTLPSGRNVAFVDVPGHERFLGNMLAGLGPAPVVLFVVAADAGWQAQSDDHRDAIAALGITRGLVVLTRSDLAAPERIAQTLTETRAGLADTGLAEAPAVTVSATRGTGLTQMCAALDEILAGSPTASVDAPIRLWIDRSFTVSGAGTVVTGTLSAGTVTVGDTLDLLTAQRIRRVTVRTIQSEERTLASIGPVSRVALNLRGIDSDEIARGDVLLSPDTWRRTDVVDVRRVSGDEFTDAPIHLTAHIGSAALPARMRPLGADHARLTLDRPLPLIVGDRIVLRDPGTRIVGGGQVVDAEPPPLSRRGDAARRAASLAARRPTDDLRSEVARRGSVTITHLRRLGLLDAVAEPGTPPDGVLVVGDRWVDADDLALRARRLRTAVQTLHREDPLAAGISRAAAPDLLGLPDDAALLDAVISAAGVETTDGYLAMPDRGTDLGPAEAAIAAVERRLADDPFAAPEADDLAALGLGDRELAAAERTGRLLRLGSGVVLTPTAPALAMRSLARLPTPFTTSEARQALHTTRRVVIPLLEHLDARGWTRRLDAGHREVIR